MKGKTTENSFTGQKIQASFFKFSMDLCQYYDLSDLSMIQPYMAKYPTEFYPGVGVAFSLENELMQYNPKKITGKERNKKESPKSCRKREKGETYL